MTYIVNHHQGTRGPLMYPAHEIRCGWTMVVALILKLLKLQKLLKSCRAHFMYMLTLCVIGYFCRINHRCNKDVIFKHEMTGLSGLALFVTLYAKRL